MRTVEVTAEWRSHHEIEVPDDWDGDLWSLDDDITWNITPQNAEIYDWDVR